MTFDGFCRRSRHRDDPVGDFARDWIGDSARPRVRTLCQVLGHLRIRGACREAIAAAREAWGLFLGEASR